MLVWRICRAQYAASAFSGEGARRYSGRWNPQGVRMVYTSSSLALAAMEVLVHLDPGVEPDDLVAVSANLPDDVKLQTLPLQSLPANWHEADCLALQEIGEQWLLAQKTVGLRVPSAAVRGEWNVLLNPEHPEFARIVLGDVEPWKFDVRALRRPA